MYFIMISQQNCNLQRAMSYLLRARALSLLVSFSLLSLLSLSFYVALSSSLHLSSSFLSSHLQGWIAERIVRRPERFAIEVKGFFNVDVRGTD